MFNLFVTYRSYDGRAVTNRLFEAPTLVDALAATTDYVKVTEHLYDRLQRFITITSGSQIVARITLPLSLEGVTVLPFPPELDAKLQEVFGL